ncbi:unnamed protein product [Parnassius apollo]|uniref:MICOS complex subunit MIC60 n=1 Tax=Parnassius apollo TaxID=110799 RepID=A0A8S3WLR0_PARAO|nr:unnamed protein product [Parnassius apollo]
MCNSIKNIESLEVQAVANRQLKEQLKRQFEIQQEILQERLAKKDKEMEKTAVKVALVGSDGASLPVYFLSWLQSKLLFQKFAEIPKDELENKPMDFTKLDTFDIIQRARYFMEHGDLQSALRYVNLLQGAPRAAASHWATAA